MAAKYFPEIDFGKGFNDQVSGDSDVEVGTLTSAPSGWTGTKKYYQLEKEVHFNSGKFVLDINGGGQAKGIFLSRALKSYLILLEMLLIAVAPKTCNGLRREVHMITILIVLK